MIPVAYRSLSQLAAFLFSCFLAAALLLPETASGARIDPGQKTASGDFFGNPDTCTRGNGLQAQEPCWLIVVTITKTASGVFVYGYRYYDPGNGRWLNRDPIAERGGVNLYGFVRNDGIGAVDHLGQWTLREVRETLKLQGVKPDVPGTTNLSPNGSTFSSGTYSDQLVFDKWIEFEKLGTSWYKTLPKCPAKLCMIKGKPKNPDDKKWEAPAKSNGAEIALHPGTYFSMRSNHTPRGHSNQCTYGNLGQLLRKAPGSGTVDLVSPSVSGGQHFSHDVAPVLLANRLDGGGGSFLGTMINGMNLPAPAYVINNPPGKNVQRYLEVRPFWAE